MEYESVTLDISDEDKISLVTRFVNTKLSEASQHAFADAVKTATIEEAIFHAVLNEAILEALIAQMDTEQQ